LRSDGRGRSEAYDVNDAGIVAGLTQINPQGRVHAFAWTEGQMYDLGTLPGRTDSLAVAINNLNQIVGWGTNGYPNDDAFIWEQARGMQRLDELIAPNARWRFNVAWDINDAGQIVGNGYRLGDAGTSVGFLLSPVDPTMDLAAPAPGRAGEANTITLTGATPGAQVTFLYSRQGGGARIPGCDLQQNALQLDSPTVIGTAIADGNGVASITRTVPPVAQNQIILFQAVVQNDCAISQLVVHRFE
jgi:probable HAF family extracellular repeat protein